MSTSTTVLPSFVELMASLRLGLENNNAGQDIEDRPRNGSHSRSSSYSSTSSFASQSSGGSAQSRRGSLVDRTPCIIVSNDPSTAVEVELDRRRYRARFSPYVPVISHIRRGSLPTTVVKEEREDIDDTFRMLPPCPRSVSPIRGVGRRSSAVALSSHPRRPEKLSLDADLMGSTPISTFVRRKTPCSSPISPTFPHRRRRSTSPSLPVTIPSLPAFCFPAQPASLSSCPSSDTDEDSLMSDASSTHLDVARRRKPRARKSHLKDPTSRSTRRPRSGANRS